MNTIAPNRCWPSRTPREYWRGLVRILSILLALISLNGPVHAATVRALQGQVLVSTGQGYRLLDGATELEPGATVVANPGAIAQVAYGGGCTVTVQPGSVYLIAAQAPCPTREPAQPGGVTDTSAPSGGSGTTWAIATGAIVVGGAAAYFLIPPLSP